jgi:alpha-L-fucosidase
MRRWAATVALLAALAFPAAAPVARAAGPYQPTQASLDTHPLPAWWRDAKFGIFIHWGPASVPAWTLPNGLAGFWYWFEQQIPGTPTWEHHLQTYGADVTYDDLIPKFTASKYDPDAWARLFKDVGARYFLLTTKHHDGFALWCSKTSHRNACDMGPRKDLVGPLVKAARREGLKAGLYYSIPEWFSPAPRPAATNMVSSAASMQSEPAGLLGDSVFNLTARNAYTQQPVPYTGYTPIADYGAGQVRPQLRELIDTYHPDEIWCDIGGAESYYRSNETEAALYNGAATTNPDGVIVNDRCGDGNTHIDFKSVEQGNGYQIGSQTIDKPTETDRAIGNWFYSDGNTDEALPSRATLLGELITAVSMNSNYVLNISPRADGTLPEPLVSRLEYLGRWLKINGEAIYGSRPWTQGADDDNPNTRFTVGRDGSFYLTTIGWPGKELRVKAQVPIPSGAVFTLLGADGRPLPWRRDGSTLVIDLPSADMSQATRSEGAATIRISAR